ncbi:MAG: diaminopimelate decarboxylase [Sphingomonadales bacterium]
MDHFHYRNGVLQAEGISLVEIAQQVGTPFYCYSTATLERHYRVFEQAFEQQDALICYAVKANSNIAVIRTLARLGAGADVVSEGELRRALKAGIPPGRIVFSGIGKSRDEMAFALDCGIYQFNVESEPELASLNEVAMSMDRRAPIALRINPDVDARTHDKISTGRKEDKFGIAWSRARETYGLAAALPGIEIVGLDIHIGSQLTRLEPFDAAFQKIAGLVTMLREDGHNIARLDLGGGLGIPYGDSEAPPLPSEYAAAIRGVLGRLDCQIILEPGRLIAGNAGVLVCGVLYIKSGERRDFVILDGAMNDLMRPTLYDAFHRIVPLVEPSPDADFAPVDIVGPVCETGDTFAVDRMMPPLASGELVAILSTGAYSAVMSSTYNTRRLAPEILVDGDRFAVVRPRPCYDDVVNLDVMPDWLNP